MYIGSLGDIKIELNPGIGGYIEGIVVCTTTDRQISKGIIFTVSGGLFIPWASPGSQG